MNLDEDQLVSRAQNGDKSAYESLYRQHVGRVYALCLRLSGHAQLAEDLVQDAFIHAWHNLGSFRGESVFSSWMYRLTSNVVLGHLRQQKRWVLVEFEEQHLQTSHEVQAEEALDLHLGLMSLPDQARTVLILHEYLGYKHKEIADITGLAQGTCKAHLHRARQLLQQRLTNER